MPMAIAEPVAGHRAKYDHLRSLMPPDDAAIQFVGGGDPVMTGFMEIENLRRIRQIDGASVIDIGCGIGRLTKYLLRENVSDYLGLDIIPEILQYAIDAAEGRSNFTFAIVEHCKLNVPDASTDIVCGFSLITHLLDEEICEYFSEARRVLRADGVAVFSFLDLAIPQVRDQFFQRAKIHRSGHGDLLRFTSKAFLELVAHGTGFSSVSFLDAHEPFTTSGLSTHLVDGRVAPVTLAPGQSICVMRP